MVLTLAEIELLKDGKAVRIESPEVGIPLILVRADLLPPLTDEDSDMLPMTVVARLVQDAMAEYDDEDPLLASYQQ